MKCNKIANASLALIMFLVIILPIFIPTSLVRAADGVLDHETTNLSFDGVDDTIKLDNLPINSEANGKNTVEFWMYWNGKNATMPFGWNTTYDLYFLGGNFGFNNGATIVGGITSTDLKNKWVHVAAVFPNGVPSVDNCELYIDGQKQTLSLVGTSTGVRSATSSAFISGWGHDSKYKFEGKLAGFRIWNYARTATEIQADMNRTLTGQENGLVGEWRLDQVSTETAYDSSTHQNHGTSAGFVSLINPVVKFSTDQKISLDWDDIVPGVTYVLTRDGVVVYEGGDSFFVDKGLTPTTSYTYSLYAKSPYGRSKSVLTDKTNNNPAPAVPTHFTGVPSANSVTLTWDTVPGATSYILLRDGKTVYSGSDTTFTDNRLAGSTKYSYSLMAVNVESPGDPAFTEVTTKTFTPVEPVNFITTDGVDDTIKIINLPVNNTPGAKTTVEFWMYWNGKNYIKPFGWYVSNLYFANGYFGFNQGDGSILGIPSAELKNKWIHVAAVFTNGAPTADTNELYINGEKQSISLFLTQQTESKTVTPMAVISGWGNNSNYKFAGKLAEVRIWNYARTAEDIQSDINRSLSGDEAGLIGAWNLDSLTTGIVYDVTKRNNGVAAGFAAPLFNLQITEKTDQRMVLTWDKIANAETYVLKRNNSIIYQGPDSTFADTGLSPFTDYTYTLIARNSNGESNEAKIIDKTNKSVLPTPANIITTATNSSITLDWDNVAGATTYELKRDDVSIYSGSESKFIDSTGLAAAKTYTYTLVAKSSTGESSPASVQVKTADPVPATPANLTGTATTTSIKLSWDVVGYAQSYELQRNGKVVYSGSELTCTDSGLTASTDYTYRLVAKNGTGESSPASLQVKTADPTSTDPTPTTPATPANLTGTATTTSITLSWDAVANAESYELKRGDQVVYTGSDLTYTDTGLKESTDYTYRLVAKNGTGESSPASLQVKTADPTSTDPTPTTPATPANLTGTATTTSITLSWDAVANAESYELKRGDQVVYTGSDLTYTDTGLKESTDYTYRLVAKNGTGESSPASLQVKTADPPPTDSTPTDPTPTTPATPANLTGTATTTSITLSWNAADNAESYELKRGDQVVYTGSDLTYTDTGLKESTDYTYRLVAKNGTGESSPALLQVKTADPTPTDSTPTDPTPTTPATPANLTGTATTTSITLSWNAAANAESYELKRGDQEVYTGSDLTYTDTGLKESTDYTYRLVAKNGTGESSPALLQVKTADPPPTDSTPTDPTPTTSAPATPTNLTGTATTTSITLSWNAAANAESYELKRNGEVVYSGNDLTYTDTGLKESTDYTYRLVAKNGTGESSPALLQVKTADPTSTDSPRRQRRSLHPATPTNLTGTATTTGIKLSWNAADNAESYELKRDGQEVYTGSDLTYTDTGLKESTSYTYTLVAKNGTGESNPASLQVKTADPMPTAPAPATPATSAGTVTTTSIKLSWNAANVTLTWEKVVNADTYELLRDGKIIYQGKLPWFTDKRLTPAKTYTYTLVAKNNTGEGTPEVIQITTKSYDGPVLEPPKFVDKLVRSSTSATLTWKKVVNADTYELLRDGKSIYKGKLTWFTDKRLTASKTYTYTLVAWSRNDSSQSSVILVTNPNSPDKIKTKDITASKIKVVWTANGNSNKTEYRVTTNNGYDSGWITDLEHTLTNLSANKRYKISITARNKAGVVSNSRTIYTKTKKK